MKIKQATVKDIDVILPLFIKYREFYQADNINVKASFDFIYQRLKQKESVIFFVEDAHGCVTGFVQLYPLFSSVRINKVWLLNDLFVTPEARKQGTGAALMACVKTYATESGASYIMLETATDNYTAQSLYESQGYHKITKCYYYELPLK
ncbi:GNAT family N-acetyltransferase [Salmonella enterica]|nr:GNAT family N-acetyltransferase [Salmonella enterica]